MMHLCDLTCASPAENLACDEVFLEAAEQGSMDELLRFWEPRTSFVVLGYANKSVTEVNLSFCAGKNIPVLRRCSGGGTVLQGPGCLNYSLILRLSEREALHSVSSTNRFILNQHRDMFSMLLGKPAQVAGVTDLSSGNLKFCGNAQRRKKNVVLFHGVILLKADIALIEKTLSMPSKQPDYRSNRSHTDFLLNLNLPASVVKNALTQTWSASEPAPEIPSIQITQLARQKYSDPKWNFRF